MFDNFYPTQSILYLILTGYLLERKVIRNRQFWQPIEALTYQLLAPLLFMLVANKARFGASGTADALIATISATVAISILIFLARPAAKLEDAAFIPVFQAAMRSNSYLFLAVVQLLYGEAGSSVAAAFVVSTFVVSNIIFTVVMAPHKRLSQRCVSSLKELLKSPLIIGTLAGLTLSAFGVHLAEMEPAKNYLVYLANAATPLNLLSVGAGLNLAIRSGRLVVYASGLKLVLMPICTTALLHLLNVKGIVADIALLYSALPCAGNAYAISKKFKVDEDATVSITTWTTLISILGITLFLTHPIE